MFKPAFEGQVCSLGYGVVDWLTEYACHGPGDVEGEPLDFSVDPEVEDFYVAAYELNPETGRRKKSKVVYSAPKGRAKSETAGLLGVAESLAPVRFDGWDANGQPVARPVVSPFIRALATEEKQSGNTFQNIAFMMGEWGQDTHPEIYGGIKGIGDYRSAQNIYLSDGGECRSSSSGSASKDGGKETFVVPDEAHLYVLREHRDMYSTVMKNLGKRKAADPWALLTTTACKLGERSVWEVIEKLWKLDQLGPEWLVHHREAVGKIDILDRDRTIRQLRKVYGAAMHPETGWMEPERVYADMLDPTICRDEAEAARYYLNRSMAGSDAWIPLVAVEDVTVKANADTVEQGEPITIGADGSLNEDSTVIRGCRLSDGFRFTIGIWEKPEGAAGVGWEVPRREVLERFRWAMGYYTVALAWFDPHEWRSEVDSLADEFPATEVNGKPYERIVAFATSREIQMGEQLDRLHTDIINRKTFQCDDPRVTAHYGNAFAWKKGRNRLVRKEYPNSPRKIDSVVGDALAYGARAKALADGWSDEPELPPLQFGM